MLKIAISLKMILNLVWICFKIWRLEFAISKHSFSECRPCRSMYTWFWIGSKKNWFDLIINGLFKSDSSVYVSGMVAWSHEILIKCWLTNQNVHTSMPNVTWCSSHYFTPQFWISWTMKDFSYEKYFWTYLGWSCKLCFSSSSSIVAKITNWTYEHVWSEPRGQAFSGHFLKLFTTIHL